ncbi:MAG: 30S ribosomal protein S9 [Candidatus Diapherotrites archaeon]|nr:30S ribosomal protein S9 [Candidatus Diapherotrites archaeon]
MVKKGKKRLIFVSKKKSAVARAIIKEGSGKVSINKRDLSTIEPKYVKVFIEEPLILAGEIAKKFDIVVKASGGGAMAQAVCARSAIAKALVKVSKDKNLEKKFRQYDRLLLVDDPRRKESKKPLGKGARKKRQKTKR